MAMKPTAAILARNMRSDSGGGMVLCSR